jgi:hypothetical protein
MARDHVMSVGRFLHRRLLLLLIGAYLLAYFFPSRGVYFRSLKLEILSGPGGLLAIMLFVAGFGIQSSNFSSIARRTKGIRIESTKSGKSVAFQQETKSFDHFPLPLSSAFSVPFI